MASKAYEIAFKLAAKMDKSYGNTFNMAEEIASRTVGKLVRTAAAIGGTVLSVDKIKDSVDKAISFESAMADVAKVVDGLKDSAGNATEEYIKMSDQILDMTSRLPMTGEELAKITASAGQAGIASEDLAVFTETAAKMGVAFDVTAEQAGDWMASWRTAFKMSQGEVTTLADQINYLSNTSSENSLKLSGVVSRIGSLGEISGVSAAEVAAMAASMTGVTEEISATGIKNLMKAMNAGRAATKSQLTVLKGLGFSAGELANRMQTDAQGAILDLLSAFKEIDPSQQSAMLTEYFGSNSVAAIAPLLNNLENLEEQFNKVSDASFYAGSMETEFASRAATTENKIKLAQNAVDRLQISIGNLMLPLIGKGANMFGDAINNITEKVPQYADKASKLIKNIWKSIEPVFGWIKKNPSTIAQFIAGIGGAIITYKVVDGITNMSKAFSLVLSANPAALALAAVAGSIALVVAGVIDANRKMKAENLASHFGNVSLSLADVEEVAKNIVRTDNLNKVSAALKAFDDMESIEASISSAVEELDKMNWKVSIGLELTNPELRSYRENIESFVSGAQELILQKQYSVNLALGVLVRSDTEEGNDIVGWVNKFYNAYYQDVGELGKQLADAVNRSFADGVLDPEEMEEILDIQSKVAEIEKKFANGKYEARLQKLKISTSGAALTPESFKAVQQALGVEVTNAVEKYDEALELSIQTAVLMHDDTWIDSEDFEKWTASVMEGYYIDVGDILVRASGFQIESIYDAYGGELSAALSEFSPAFVEAANNMVMNAMANGEFTQFDINVFMSGIKELKGLDPVVKANIASLYTEMAPTLQQYEKIQKSCEEYGIAVPESIARGLLEIQTIGALSESGNAIFTLLGALIGEDNPKFAAMIAEYERAGGRLPEEFAAGVGLKYDSLEKSALSMAGFFTGTVKTELEKGLDVTVPIRATADYQLKIDELLNRNPSAEDIISGLTNSGIPKFATGTDYTPRSFIAGERGPELITNAGGMKVFTASETRGIFNGFSQMSSSFGTLLGIDESFSRFGNLFSEDESDLQGKMQSLYNSTSIGGASVEVNFNPEIKIEGGGHDETEVRRQVEDVLMSKLFPLFKQMVRGVIDDEIEREMRLANG